MTASPTEDEAQSLDQQPTSTTERVSSLVRTEIDRHLKGKERVEKSLPQSVDIGPFHVNTDTVRLALAKKHKEIVQALLDFLVVQLRKESEQVSECCVFLKGGREANFCKIVFAYFMLFAILVPFASTLGDHCECLPYV